jgi:nicotinate-nucleotide adenylyltransferase
MNIGVLGGTFDPIHLGHLAAAEEVRAKLGLVEVLFVPAGHPWLKVDKSTRPLGTLRADRSISPAKHRVEMVKLAIAGYPHFKLSTCEVDRPGPSYAVDTIGILQQQLGTEARLFFLLGSDALSELPQWKEPSRLIQICHLVAFTRPGFALPPLESLESAIPGLSQHVTFVEVPQVDISATQIRNRVSRGASIHGLVPQAVERYILEQGLYLTP